MGLCNMDEYRDIESLFKNYISARKELYEKMVGVLGRCIRDNCDIERVLAMLIMLKSNSADGSLVRDRVLEEIEKLESSISGGVSSEV
ncbi:MAG TPA: hypothetical protein PK986_12850 [Spirochaetota bacterium]|nr:hypothetical protein [Spirochaetota bacterium]